MKPSLEIPKAPERAFAPSNLNIDNWEELEVLLLNLVDRTIDSPESLKKWLKDKSELDAVISENVGRRYIAMTVDTKNEEAAKSYEYFVTQINPKLSPFEDKLNKKLDASEYKKLLVEEGFDIYLRSVSSSIELYREENIELFAKDAQLAQKYGAIAGKQSINYNGEEITMQQASKFLKDSNREVRREVFELLSKRRLEDQNELDEVLSEMIQVRTQIAKNAGFENYRDYKCKAMGRFDYSVQDCFDFHKSIEECIIPILRKSDEARRAALNLDVLKPFDTSVPTDGQPPLKPFENADELLDKTIKMFYEIDEYCGERLEIMKEMNHLDLASKKGKAPGGYNYPLYEIGVPFIFMNSVGLHRDLVTMVHEGGHAVHSFLSRDLDLVAFKSLTSEIAELASMSMELISMEHWDQIYSDNDLIKAKKEQLLGVLEVLPWVATVDAFQHWLYENPDHTVEERHANWKRIHARFSTNVVDWSDYEAYHDVIWQKQLHIYEVPFYYIEYGLAQLGAIAVWKNYVQDRKTTIDAYKSALSLGYTRTIPEVYEEAGVKFDFSKDYINQLASFVSERLAQLN